MTARLDELARPDRHGALGRTRTCAHGSGGPSADLSIAEAHREVIAVTADRELATRVRAADAEVVGPNWLLDRLVD